MNMKRFLVPVFFFAAFVPALLPSIALAATVPGGGSTGQTVSGGGNTGTSVTTLINPLNTGDCSSIGIGSCIGNFLNGILEFVVRIGSIVVLLMLIYIGYLFVVAQGNQAKLTEARRALLWTVVGALILLGAQAISLGIQATVQSLSTGSTASSGTNPAIPAPGQAQPVSQQQYQGQQAPAGYQTAPNQVTNGWQNSVGQARDLSSGSGGSGASSPGTTGYGCGSNTDCAAGYACNIDLLQCEPATSGATSDSSSYDTSWFNGSNGVLW